jgi:hypothetical protein
MANVKRSQLTAKGSNLVASDRVAIAQDNGGGTFASKYVKGSEIHNWDINKETSSYTLVLGDAHHYVEMEDSTANNLTVPTNASVAFPVGTEIRITQLGTGQTTILAAFGVTIRTQGGKNKTVGQYSVATLFKRGTNEWYLFGDLTT